MFLVILVLIAAINIGSARFMATMNNISVWWHVAGAAFIVAVLIILPENQVKDFILNELDGIYSNQASPNYVKHIIQNWNSEPFIKGGYMTDFANWKMVRELGKSVSGKLYFAGGEYTDGEDWVSIHAAALSAKKAVEEITTP